MLQISRTSCVIWENPLNQGKLNLRDGPGVRHGVIAELPIGTLLRQIAACVGSDDGVSLYPWCKVDWNGTKRLGLLKRT